MILFTTFTLEACSVDDSVSLYHLDRRDSLTALPSVVHSCLRFRAQTMRQALYKVTCVSELKSYAPSKPKGQGHRLVSSPPIQTFTDKCTASFGFVCCPCVMQPRPSACCSCTLLSHSLLQTCTDCSRTLFASYALRPLTSILHPGVQQPGLTACSFPVLLD